MNKQWLRTAVVFGIGYIAVGIVTAELSKSASSDNLGLVWRWTAWVLGLFAFGAHLLIEHFRLHNAPRAAAWHASLGVAIGGFGIAAAANIHELMSAHAYRPLLAVALVAWPVLTALPAFVVAYAGAAIVARLKPHRSTE